MTAAGQYDGKRFIEVATEKKHDMLLITVDNSFDGILFQENGKIYSKNGKTNRKELAILSMKNFAKNTAEPVASKRSATGSRPALY